jgi:hypothetical protein
MVNGLNDFSTSVLGAPGAAISACVISNPACPATSGAQPCTSAVSSNDPLWYPAVSESPRNTVVEKFPATAGVLVLPLDVPEDEEFPLEQLASNVREATRVPSGRATRAIPLEARTFKTEP